MSSAGGYRRTDMARLRVHNFAVSLDGFAAGPRQSLDDPMGVGGMALHQWALATPAFHEQHGVPAGPEGASGFDELDDRMIRAGTDGIGATIMGRNMFSPGRGPWDEAWTGWWGETPPFGHAVFVLTHHERDPLPMAGGTTFHFVTGGIEEALQRATDAAGELDIRLGGGTATVRQYLRAGLIDQLHLAVAPVLLGSGERLLGDLDGFESRYRVADRQCSSTVCHLTLVPA